MGRERGGWRMAGDFSPPPPCLSTSFFALWSTHFICCITFFFHSPTPSHSPTFAALPFNVLLFPAVISVPALPLPFYSLLLQLFSRSKVCCNVWNNQMPGPKIASPAGPACGGLCKHCGLYLNFGEVRSGLNSEITWNACNQTATLESKTSTYGISDLILKTVFNLSPLNSVL